MDKRAKITPRAKRKNRGVWARGNGCEFIKPHKENSLYSANTGHCVKSQVKPFRMGVYGGGRGGHCWEENLSSSELGAVLGACKLTDDRVTGGDKVCLWLRTGFLRDE